MDVSRTDPEVFAPVGRCIYCGKTEAEGAVLSKEHVIPEGLGGSLHLPRSSCEDCRLITHAFETEVLRGTLLPRRLHSGLVRARGEIRDLKVTTKGSGGVRTTMVHPDDVPGYLILPRLTEPPGYFWGNMSAFLCAEYVMWGKASEFERVGIGADEQLVEVFPMRSYTRMLAKIAHSLACGSIGITNFDPWLTEFIRGEASPPPGYFMGLWSEEVDTNEDLPNRLHHVGLGLRQIGGQYLVVARVQLFASHDQTPNYSIVVGELTSRDGLYTPSRAR